MDQVQEKAVGLRRGQWIKPLQQVALPVLQALSRQQLRNLMPVEFVGGSSDRPRYTHLEAFGRLMAGLAPWLENQGDEPGQKELRGLARQCLAVAVDPASPDYLNFCEGSQPLVDAAFLAHAVLRAPRVLWRELDEKTRRQLVEAMKFTRRIKPPANNWLLFSAMVEAFLAMAGERLDAMRVDYAIRQHEQWYKGDGAYGDGPEYHFDYYNSFVIQPMLLDVLEQLGGHDAYWQKLSPEIKRRAQRFGVVLERMVAPDGTFPVLGRSITYRCGVMQLLAQLALQHKLPGELPPAQVRGAIGAVIRRTLGAPGTFDDAGWLRIGLSGHQPGLGESYISTGSLYLCAAAFLPLGLPGSDPFWMDEDIPFTAQKIWGGKDAAPDHALM